MDQFFLILPRYSLFKFTLLINLTCYLFYPAIRFLSLPCSIVQIPLFIAKSILIAKPNLIKNLI